MHEGVGVVTGRDNPCMYHYLSKQILCLLHGDGFVSAGSPERLKWLKGKFEGRFEIKTKTVGKKEEEGEVKETRILNRIVRVTKDGWEYEVEQRHADLIIQEM